MYMFMALFFTILMLIVNKIVFHFDKFETLVSYLLIFMIFMIAEIADNVRKLLKSNGGNIK